MQRNVSRAQKTMEESATRVPFDTNLIHAVWMVCRVHNHFSCFAHTWLLDWRKRERTIERADERTNDTLSRTRSEVGMAVVMQINKVTCSRLAINGYSLAKRERRVRVSVRQCWYIRCVQKYTHETVSIVSYDNFILVLEARISESWSFCLVLAQKWYEKTCPVVAELCDIYLHFLFVWSPNRCCLPNSQQVNIKNFIIFFFQSR